MRIFRLAYWGLLVPMLLNANTVSAQLLEFRVLRSKP